MKEQWLALSDKFNAKPQRERLILAALLLTVLWAVFDFILLAPLHDKEKDLSRELATAQKELDNLSAQEKVLVQAISNDPNAARKQEIARLQKQLSRLDESLEKLSVGLMPAKELPDALHGVLQSVGNLKLVAMETLPPSRLRLASEAEEESVSESEAVLTEEEQDLAEIERAIAQSEQEPVKQPKPLGVYKHSVVVSLEGRYFDVLEYLNALENLPWRVYWESLEYEVAKYPKAKVRIEVYTLSTEQGVLGV